MEMCDLAIKKLKKKSQQSKREDEKRERERKQALERGRKR